MAWTAICLLPLLQTSTKVDFEIRATTLPNVLGKLSKQVGRAYVPSSELAGEILCIRVRGIALSDLENQIADTLDAEWITEGETRRLSRTPRIVQGLSRIELKAREKWLEELFDRKAKELAQLNTPFDQADGFLRAQKALEEKIAGNPQGISLDGPRLAAPASILANALVIDLGAQAIAALPSGHSYVFASSPNGAQRPLGRRASVLIKEFEQAEARLADLLPDRAPDGALVSDVYTRHPESDPVGKVLVTVYPRGRIVSFNSSIYSKSGKLRSWGLAGTYFMGDDPWTRETVAGTGAKPVNADLSIGSRELDTIAPFQLDTPLFMQELVKEPWTATTETQRKILLNPETVDPLSLHVTDACFALAEHKGQNLIAYLSDDMVRAARMASKGESIDLTRFQAIATTNGTSFQSKAACLVVKPKSVLAATDRRLPRAPFGRFLRNVVEAGGTELEPLSRFHFESNNTAFYSVLVRMYRNALASRGIPGMTGEESHAPEVYCALGSLAPSQWLAVNRGNTLDIGRMPQSQKSQFARWVRYTPYLETAPQVPDLLKQPTEFAPLGLPAGAQLSSKESEGLVLRTITRMRKPDGTESEIILNRLGSTIEEMTGGYARSRYYKSVEDFTRQIRKSKLEYSTRRDRKFRFQILPGHWIEESFFGSPRNAKVAEFDKLPEQIKLDVLSSFERQFRDRDGGRF